MQYKQYIGDGVCVQYDGYHLILTTEKYRVFLDPTVFSALVDYAKSLGMIEGTVE